MGKKFLIDTNVIIDLFGNRLPADSMTFITKLPIVISSITRIELEGKHNAGDEYAHTIKAFIKDATIHGLDEPVILETIRLRRKYKIKLPDGIIAATTLVNKLTLITHDVNDYARIHGLGILDSWKIK